MIAPSSGAMEFGREEPVPASGPARAVPRLSAVVAAMAEELAPLSRLVRDRQRERLSFGTVRRGRLGGAEVVLASTGEGRGRARDGAGELLDNYPAELLIVVGVSGGLSAGLEPGTVVVASRLHDEDASAPAAPDPAWLARALETGDVTGGTVLTSDRVLCSAVEKASALRRLDTAEPAVVDLESGGFVEAAARRGVACLVLRAVCDAAEEDLPIDFNACRRDDGRIDRLAVARRAALAPRAARDLLRLRRRVGSASARLAGVVGKLLGGEDHARG